VRRGNPIPIRFPIGDEKSIRIYAIETDKTFSAAVRDLVRRGLSAVAAETRPQPPQPQPQPQPRNSPPARRMLSRGVVP